MIHKRAHTRLLGRKFIILNNEFLSKTIRTGVSVTYPPLMYLIQSFAVARGSTPRFGIIPEPSKSTWIESSFFVFLFFTVSECRGPRFRWGVRSVALNFCLQELRSKSWGPLFYSNVHPVLRGRGSLRSGDAVSISSIICHTYLHGLSVHLFWKHFLNSW